MPGPEPDRSWPASCQSPARFRRAGAGRGSRARRSRPAWAAPPRETPPGANRRTRPVPRSPARFRARRADRAGRTARRRRRSPDDTRGSSCGATTWDQCAPWITRPVAARESRAGDDRWGLYAAVPRPGSVGRPAPWPDVCLPVSPSSVAGRRDWLTGTWSWRDGPSRTPRVAQTGPTRGPRPAGPAVARAGHAQAAVSAGHASAAVPAGQASAMARAGHAQCAGRRPHPHRIDPSRGPRRTGPGRRPCEQAQAVGRTGQA